MKELTSPTGHWCPGRASPTAALVVCALHGVSPRDRWSCVLPRWLFIVNVNVNSRFSALCAPDNRQLDLT